MTFSPHLLIRASAGSGKTHQLTSRFIGLLTSGEDPAGILAVTFTRRAAGEIMERVLLRMLSATGNPEALKQLQDSLVEAGFGRATSEQIEIALRGLVDQLHRCGVSTLDAFFARLAIAHTFECRLPPGWTILEKDQLEAVQAAAIQQILADGGQAKARILMHRLSRGKATSQVADQLEQIVSHGHDKYIEFPYSAWQNPQMSPTPDDARVQQVLDLFHSVTCPLTKAGTPKKNWQGALTRLGTWFDHPDGADALGLFKSGLALAVLNGESKFDRVEIPEDIFISVQLIIETARAHIASTILAQNIATRELLASYDRYRSIGLHTRGGVAFQDIPQALAVASVLASADTILYRLDASTRHLLLDEFQDTSLLQFAALRPLIEEVASDSDGGRTVFCVGDPKQAIYGWRGGRAEVLDLLQDFLKPGSDQTLDKSYRSSQEILDGVNTVFGNLPPEEWLATDRQAISNWCVNFHDHVSAAGGPGDAPGHIVLKVAQQHPDRDIAVCPYIDAIDEVERIIGISTECSIAILVRKNQNIARMVAALRERGIDASEEGGNPLVDSPAVGRLVALLELIEHPGDSTMRFAVAHSPLPQIARSIGGFPDGDWQDSQVARAISDTLRRRIHERGITEAIAPLAEGLAQICSPEDRVRIRQMMEQIHIRRFRGCRLEELIAHLRTHHLSSPSGSRVEVMTVHQAKGLGRDVVILPELAPDWFKVLPNLLEQRATTDPSGERWISRYISKLERQILGEPYLEMNRQARQSQLQEALSVLYVAMTRARRSLIMILPAKKPPEASAAHLLLHTLGEGQPVTPGATLYERGDAGCPALIPGEPETLSTEAQVPQLSIPSVGVVQTPSQHSATFSSEASFRARSIGTLVHFAFEQLEWAADLPPDIEELLSREYPRLSPFIEETVKLLAEAVQERGLRATLDRTETEQRLGKCDGDQLVLEREVPFCCNNGDDLLNGIIDRLVILERDGRPIAAEVIDFKTDQINQSSQQTAEKHADQMESYRLAVSKTWGIETDRIDCRVLLVKSGELVTL